MTTIESKPNANKNWNFIAVVIGIGLVVFGWGAAFTSVNMKSDLALQTANTNQGSIIQNTKEIVEMRKDMQYTRQTMDEIKLALEDIKKAVK